MLTFQNIQSLSMKKCTSINEVKTDADITPGVTVWSKFNGE